MDSFSQIDPSIADFLTRFFEVSDISPTFPPTSGSDAGAAADAAGAEIHEKWASFFRGDATLVMGSEKGCGLGEIRKLREGMWQHVATRKHTVAGAFVGVGDSEDKLAAEFMLHGMVAYRLRGKQEGEEESVDWAAHGRLVKDTPNQPWGFAYYRVYIQR